MPIQYEGIVAEHQAVRQKAGLFDVSHMGELRLRGPEATRFVNRLVTNDLSAIEPGRALYTCCCKEDGGILDDLILYKHAEDDILIVCNASNREKIVGHFAKQAANEPEVTLTDESDETALVALQGPLALEILQAAACSVENVADAVPRFHFRRAEVAGLPCVVARTGYTGEDGVEIFCRSTDAPALWSALLAAGKNSGLVPVGLGARDTLRLEARLSLYGNDIDETTNPLEAGLGWCVKFDKDEFIGKEALLRVREHGLERKIVGFEMTGRGVARHGYPLLDGDGQVVGTCTSGSPGPTVGRNIGLGYVPSNLTEIGTEFQVDCRGRKISAVVVKTPFYKRPRAS